MQPEPHDRDPDSAHDANDITDESRKLRRDRVQAELDRVRKEASLARLEAKATELESVLQRIDDGERIDDAEWQSLGINGEASPTEQQTGSNPDAFDSWQAIRDARSSDAASAAVQGRTDLPDRQLERTDAAHVTVPMPAMRRVDASSTPLEVASEPVQPTVSPDDAHDLLPFRSAESSPAKVSVASLASLEATSETAPSRRSRPAAWIVSTLVHVGVFLMLMMITLTTTLPKDQVFLAASVGESENVSMETFSLESAEPVREPSESTPSETTYDISPVGEMMAVALPDDIVGQSAAMPSMSALSSTAKSTLQSLAGGGKSQAKMAFCGVEGGGNHFVYLVDSSGSMKEGFDSARQALLQSINMLTEKQRFYVVFFDAEPDFMQLSTPGVDEPRSVYATAENKQRLNNWAMRISMDRGRAPYDPLRFALELKPDVIFLLSDGEFPQAIEDLLAEENKVTNLFGEADPISIVHTISYHSQEGESRMRRIAQNNFGQYRYVPKP
ncbi:MAG: hypothetical protein AAF670_01290 [Planctomycetota bacterium]